MLAGNFCYLRHLKLFTMSWSVYLIGKPENVVKALNDMSGKLEGASKQEFDTALPNLTALVKMNFNNSGAEASAIRLSASGHSFSNGIEPQYGSCQVTLENIGGTMV